MRISKSTGSFIALGIIFLLSILIAILFYRHTLLSYQDISFPWAEDQATFNQVFWNLAHSGSLFTTVHEKTFFGMHFTPIIFLLLPFYLLYQNPPSLFLMAILTTCLTAPLIFLLAEKITGSRFVAFCVSLIFLAYPPLTLLNTHGFRFLIISIPFVTLSLYCFLTKKLSLFLLFMVLASFCREEVSAVFIGVAFWSFSKRRSKEWVIAPAVWGITYFFTVINIIMPLLNNSTGTGGAGFEAYHYLGRNGREILLTMATNFKLVISALSRPHILFFLRELLQPLLYFPLFSPLLLFFPFSQYLLIFLASYDSYANVSYWYFAPIVPFIFLALAYFLKKMIALNNFLNFPAKLLPSVIVIILLLYILSIAPLFRMFSPVSPSPREATVAITKFSRLIPSTASLTTQTPFTPYYSSRKEIRLFRKFPSTDYILFDPTADNWPLSREEFNRIIAECSSSKKYRLVAEVGNYKLMQKATAVTRSSPHESLNP